MLEKKLEELFHCRKLKVHAALWCSSPSENITLLFLFQIANFISSFLLLKTQECVLINVMSFSSHKFVIYIKNICWMFSVFLSFFGLFDGYSLICSIYPASDDKWFKLGSVLFVIKIITIWYVTVLSNVITSCIN